MACRNLEKAEEAKVDIEKACKDVPDTGHLVLAKCDLSSLKSIREFAQNILDSEPQVNILIPRYHNKTRMHGCAHDVPT